MIFTYLASALIIGFVSGVLFHRKQWKNWYTWLFVLSLVLLLVVSIQFVRASGGHLTWDIEPELWAQFGAFVGSLMIVMTIAFQIISFRKQQVEAKFFELVKYYRDNISEMRSRNPFFYKDLRTGRAVDEEFVHGRRVMKTIFEQYKVGRRLAEQIESTSKIKRTSAEFDKVKDLFKKYDWKMQSKIEWTKRYRINEMAYLFTYWGIPVGIDTELRRCLLKLFKNQAEVSKVIDLVKTIPALYECGSQASTVKLKLTQSNGHIEIEHRSKGYVKFFGGHQYQLGHFFRHLYQSVKYIDEQPWWLLSQDEKYGYIKTLRAQMSNYEQAMLFVDSLTQLGRKWEYENKQNKELISKYHLIKNLPESFISEMEPQYFYPKVDYEWKNKLKT